MLSGASASPKWNRRDNKGGKVPPPRLVPTFPSRSPSSTAGSSPDAGSNKGDDDDDGARLPAATSYHSFGNRHGSFEMVRPAHDSIERQASLQVAIFNLVCTIVGGGVLSLPYAFAKAGVVLGCILLVIIAIASDFSAYILISCARRSGGRTYEDVAEKAFGRKAKVLTSFLLLAVTFLSCVGYIVLMGDLIPPVLCYVFDWTLTDHLRTIIVLVCLAMVYPLCCSDNLSGLKYTCVFSFLSVVVLAVCVGYRSVQRNSSEPIRLEKLSMSGSFSDALIAFPIISIAYLCHFNVLPMNCELQKPTRERIKSVLHVTMSVCTVMYVVIGLLGYSYAMSDTLGNVLLNFPTNDAIITLGRGCLGLTCLFNFPLLVLPCRVSVKKCIASIFGTKLQPSRSNSEESANGRPHHRVRRTPRNTAPLLATNGAVDDDVDEEGGMDAADDEPEAPIDARSMNHPSSLRRMLQTALLIGLSFLLSKFVPGVATIWSIMGSSVSMAIAYILPSLFYLKLRGHKEINPRKVGAFLLLVTSIVAACVCTYLSIEQAFGQAVADALIN